MFICFVREIAVLFLDELSVFIYNITILTRLWGWTTEELAFDP